MRDRTDQLCLLLPGTPVIHRRSGTRYVIAEDQTPIAGIEYLYERGESVNVRRDPDAYPFHTNLIPAHRSTLVPEAEVAR